MQIPIVPLVVATALFMERMDSTILATALPTIARDLGIDVIALKLAVTAYLVSLAVFIPVSGWVADRLGARTTFRTALAIFMAASIGCAFSRSLEAFAMWRFVQGLGGAMMVPVGRLVILRAVPKAGLVRALAFLTVPSLVGPMLGPPLGGFIVTYADWRWIFFVNIPIGLLGIALATIYFNNERQPRRPLDLKGFVLSATALSGLVLGASVSGRHIAPWPIAVALFATGAAAAALYVRHARTTKHPLLDLSLLRLDTFDAGVVGGVLFRIGVGASGFLVPLMLQIGFGYDALTSGLITFAGAIGALAMKPLTGPVLAAVGFRRVLVANGLAASAMIGAAALFTPATPHLVMSAVLLVSGLLRSLQFTSLHAISYADVEPHETSAATSLAGVAQQVSVSLGVAIGAVALELSAAAHGHAPPAAADFSMALTVVAAISALCIARLWRLPADAGRALSGPVREGEAT